MRRRQQAGGPRGDHQARRAVFMPDGEVFPPPEGQAQWQPTGGAFQDAADNAWQAAFIPRSQDDFLYGFQEEPAEYPHDPPLPREEVPARRGRWGVLAVMSLALIIGIGYWVLTASRAEQDYNNKAESLGSQVFFDQIYVDGYPVGGMTFAQAESALAQQAAAARSSLAITLNVDEATYQITQQQLPFQRNTRAVLEEAWSIGRQGFSWMVGEDITPFEVRWRHVAQTARDKAYFATQVTYEAQDLRALCESIAGQISREPVNAVVASFDFSTKAFTVTRDVPGRRIEPNDLMAPLAQALDRGDYQAIITLDSTPILPRVTSVDLQNGFAMLASFTTKTTSDNDRNNNIALAARALNGKSLMPGEALSFNESTGKRTIESGYRGAPAIAGGVLIDDVGGGVCQVSSTLFNAAALAGMTIVEREPHAWPSSYVDKGLDATVNWPNLDFVFRNDKEAPVFLIAYYADRKVTVEIYGMRTGPGESLKLETEVTGSTVPPNEPLMQPNPSLPPGARQELKKARTGFVVDTYRVYFRDGVAYRREKLFTSRYPMVQQVIEYN
ncbi:MAG: VanW family protein [Eubacteriales bacterium]|nr:VanW family protein [Eubacteriales bacterium]